MTSVRMTKTEVTVMLTLKASTPQQCFRLSGTVGSQRSRIGTQRVDCMMVMYTAVTICRPMTK